MDDKLVNILNEMAGYLSISQMKKLQEVLLKNLTEDKAKQKDISNSDYLKLFLAAKRIEGCSERTLQYYRVTAENLLQHVLTPIRKITTDEIRSIWSIINGLIIAVKLRLIMFAGIYLVSFPGWKKKIIF